MKFIDTIYTSMEIEIIENITFMKRTPGTFYTSLYNSSNGHEVGHTVQEMSSYQDIIIKPPCKRLQPLAQISIFHSSSWYLSPLDVVLSVNSLFVLLFLIFCSQYR